VLNLPKVQLQKVRKVGAMNHVKYDVNTFQPRKHVLQETVKFCFCSVNKTEKCTVGGCIIDRYCFNENKCTTSDRTFPNTNSNFHFTQNLLE
jgi:hypothetical protein